MKPARRGWKLATTLGVALVLAAMGIVVALWPHNRVTLGTTFSNGSSRATLRLSEPFRAMLKLATPLPAAGRAHVEVRRVDGTGEHVERELTARASAGYDELYLAFLHSSQVVDGPGTFRVVFLLDDRELGAASMVVTE